MTASWDTGPRHRRRGALRGLSALPVPRVVEQEPVPLAVRRSRAAGRGRRGYRRGRHAVGAVSGSARHRSELTLVVRFLHLQRRRAERASRRQNYQPVDELTTASGSWLTWDEAVESEFSLRPDGIQRSSAALVVADRGGRGLRHRGPSTAGGWCASARRSAPTVTVGVEADRRGRPGVGDRPQHRRSRRPTKDEAIATLADRHPRHRRGRRRGVRLAARTARTPPTPRQPGAASTGASRCWPGRPASNDLLLISPIILYDHPEIAEQSEGALYDSTEIDEILTLRVMTMTDDGEGAGPRHRSAGGADHRPLRQHVARGDAATCTACCATHAVARAPGSFPRYPKASTGGIRWPTTRYVRISTPCW